MKWEKVKLSEVTEYITDGDHQPAPKSDSGVLFVKIKDIQDNRLTFDNALFVPQEYYNRLPKNRKAEYGDTLYTVVGSYGIPAFVNHNIPFCFERNIALLHPNNRVIPKYLYYAVNNPIFYGNANNIANGSAQKLIPLSKLAGMEISVPPIERQETIVNILSAYDDLIENNQKQIKLLEEAAQRLYKEWFIDLRFPGHENVKIVDGVPEGWENASVTDLLEIRYGKDHKGLADGCIPVYGSGGIMRKVDKILYSGESVLIPRKGSLNNILLVSGDFWTIDTMFYSVPKRPNVAKYVYLYLTGIDMYAMNIGAAVPSMSVKILDGMRLLCPSDSILELFETTAKPYYEMIELLKKKQSMLGETRDRLLPKLMSGEIEV